MAEQRRIGVGIIGAGLMGGAHARALANMPDVDLRGVAAADTDQARELGAAHDVTAFQTVEALLADPAIEAVTIATPTDTHVAVGLAAIAAAKHVFVEKPIARHFDEARQLVDAAREAGRVLAVGHVIRYFPDYRAIGEQIASGAIGEPAVATFGRRCQKPDWSPDAWHTTLARSGGTVLDMLVHDIDLVRWYFGEPTRVYCRTTGPDRWGGLDYGLATLHVPDGPICHLHASWAEPSGFSQQAEVCGSRGMLTYDSRGREPLQFASHDTGGNDLSAVTALPAPPPGADDPFRLQLGDWLGEIRGEGTLVNDGDWALGTLRIALALLESSELGVAIELSEDLDDPHPMGARPIGGVPRNDEVPA